MVSLSQSSAARTQSRVSFAPDYATTPYWNDDQALRGIDGGLAAQCRRGRRRRGLHRPLGSAGNRDGGAIHAGPRCRADWRGRPRRETAGRWPSASSRSFRALRPLRPCNSGRIYREGTDAMVELRALARTPDIDVGWRDCGCFCGAHTARHLDRLRRAVETQPRGFEERIPSSHARSRRARSAAPSTTAGLCTRTTRQSIH